jgi:creatinine amidohydrolase
METSFALAYIPELVGRNPDGSFTADEGQPRPLRFEALANNWVTITRPWHLLTTNAGCGNPHAATADKGHKMMQVLVERLAPFLAELSAAEIDEWFPFQPP